MTNSTPVRERCAACHHISPISFAVPDEVWNAVIHPQFVNSILCLSCFASRADEKMVRWCRDITFYPTSMATLVERQVRGG